MVSSSREVRFLHAMRLLDDGRAQEALQIGNALVSSDDEGDRLSGYLCLGFTYEDGGEGHRPDMERAIHNYRQAALIAPDPVTFCCLARSSMKRSDGDGYQDALRFLQEAAKLRLTPAVALGFAHYHRVKPHRDLEEAKKFYLRAAVSGRFSGFFGYSAVARELSQQGRALVADCIRTVLGPLIALLLGRRAQDRF
ncbi:hypothetical protein [Stenotrophomonas sp.]|uniref:hypothetical protein n=1 Tax=Stenotrophomonas sp. TaxID=69392 RepID=UPI002FC8247D